MKNETSDTIQVRNFNDVTVHHNSEGEGFFAASSELAVPAGGQSAIDDSKHEDPRGRKMAHMTHNHHKQQYSDKYNKYNIKQYVQPFNSIKNFLLPY
jgi:hypothetical protein